MRHCCLLYLLKVCYLQTYSLYSFSISDCPPTPPSLSRCSHSSSSLRRAFVEAASALGQNYSSPLSPAAPLTLINSSPITPGKVLNHTPIIRPFPSPAAHGQQPSHTPLLLLIANLRVTHPLPTVNGQPPSHAPLCPAAHGQPPTHTPLYAAAYGQSPSHIPLYPAAHGQPPSHTPLYPAAYGQSPSHIPAHGQPLSHTPLPHYSRPVIESHHLPLFTASSSHQVTSPPLLLSQLQSPSHTLSLAAHGQPLSHTLSPAAHGQPLSHDPLPHCSRPAAATPSLTVHVQPPSAPSFAAHGQLQPPSHTPLCPAAHGQPK